MLTWNDFIAHMGAKEWILVAIIAVVAVFCREGWRLKKLFGGKR
jgi:hypothetical protein